MRVGPALYGVHVQENGVPQGGVSSCKLFIVKINSLRKALPPTISYSMYVDNVRYLSNPEICPSANVKSSLELINLLAGQIKMVLNVIL